MSAWRAAMARAGTISPCSNPDLLIWKDGILNRYYEEATLKADLARRVFLIAG